MIKATLISFELPALVDYQNFALTNKTIFKRINQLIEDILRQPFSGLGKPEPLKRDLQDFWSRRITREHRLIYSVQDDQLFIAAVKYHYHK